MILPMLHGPACAALDRRRRLRDASPTSSWSAAGPVAARPPGRAPAAGRRGRAHRHARGRRPARPAPPARDPPGHQAEQHHVPRPTAARCWSISAWRATTGCPTCWTRSSACPWAPGPTCRPSRCCSIRNDPRSDLFALGVILYLPGHRARGPSARRPACSGLRRRLYEQTGAAARPASRTAALAAGDHPALPGGRSGAALRHGRAAGLRPVPSGQRRAERARGSATRRSRHGRAGAALAGRLGQSRSPRTITQQLGRAPIVMAAVDLSQEWEALGEALARRRRPVNARRAPGAPGLRHACCARARIAAGKHDRRRRRAPARAAPGAAAALGPPAGPAGARVTFHVLEAAIRPTPSSTTRTATR